MSSTDEFRRIADALMAACGPVDGAYRYVGAVAPGLGVPLVDVQRILDKMERLGPRRMYDTEPAPVPPDQVGPGASGAAGAARRQCQRRSRPRGKRPAHSVQSLHFSHPPMEYQETIFPPDDVCRAFMAERIVHHCNRDMVSGW